MKPVVIILTCLTLFAPATEAALDLSRAAVWGPPTEADDLAFRLMEARWLEDEKAFERAKVEFWEQHPSPL